MSTISQLVKQLRDLENDPEIDCYGINELNNVCARAADTIEALSAKLAAANSGGWIACEDRLPENFEVVLAFTEEKQIVTVARDGEDWVLYNQGIIKEKVLAWQPLPEPYRP